VLFNNSRYFGQNNRDSKIRIILIHITDARCGDLYCSLSGQGETTPAGGDAV
jgi:hypothetical protein